MNVNELDPRLDHVQVTLRSGMGFIHETTAENAQDAARQWDDRSHRTISFVVRDNPDDENAERRVHYLADEIIVLEQLTVDDAQRRIDAHAEAKTAADAEHAAIRSRITTPSAPLRRR